MPSPQEEPRRGLRDRLGPPGGRLPLIAAIAVVVVLADAISKQIALDNLAGKGQVHVIDGLVSFELYRNFAGPNNILPGNTVLISIFAIIASAVLVVVATRVRSTSAAIAVGLLLGGAIGNLLDRIFREPAPLHGGVIDWLRLTDRSKSMNLADLAIDAAILVLLVSLALTWWRQRGEDEDRKGTSLAP